MKIEQDKIYHFLGIGGITFVTVFLTGLMTTSFTVIYITALVLSTAVSVGKELYDERPGGTGFSVPDLIADTAGFVAGLALGMLALSF